MAKIDIDTLELFRQPEDLVSYIALHRYEPENENLIESEHFQELPQHWTDIIYIMDFETFYDVASLFSFLENPPGVHLAQTIESFRRTNNTEIADLLEQIPPLLQQHDVTPAQLHQLAIERTKAQEEREKHGEGLEVVEPDFPELRASIAEIEELLRPLMDEKDYWENIAEVIKPLMNTQPSRKRDI